MDASADDTNAPGYAGRRAQSNLELARAGFQAFAEGGVEALLPYIHPEFEMTTPAGLAAEPDTYRGHAGVRRYFDSFDDAMTDVRLEPHEFHQVGELVVVEFTLEPGARAPASTPRSGRPRCGRSATARQFGWSSSSAPRRRSLRSRPRRRGISLALSRARRFA